MFEANQYDAWSCLVWFEIDNIWLIWNIHLNNLEQLEFIRNSWGWSNLTRNDIVKNLF